MVFTPPSEFEPFRLEVDRDRDVARVAPVGELDMATVGEVEARMRELREAGCSELVLDLRGVSFLDSSALRVILCEEALARREGLALSLIPGPDVVQRVFAITGTLARLPFRSPS